MNRRSFLRAATGAAGATLLRPDGVWGNTSTPADLLLRGALVYDGTGAPPFEADVAVAADRIAAVGRKLGVAGEVFDLRGLALAPGFIDIHSHTDRALLVNARADSKVRQGVTTEVAGQDGSSMGPWTDERLARIQSEFRDAWGIRIDFRDLGGFFTRLEAQPPAVNLASMVGAGTVRGYVIGEEDRPATDEELARMVALVEQALQQGACGLSSGLEYVPGASATREELVALAVPLRGTGLPYASHIRNEEDGLFGAIEEALHVGRRAGVPVQVSHLKAQGRRNWWKAAPALGMLESARAAGVDVAFDCYPYVAYSTDLGGLFPVWARLGGTSAFLARLEDAALRPRIEAAVRDKVERLGSWDAVQITQARSPALSWATGRRLGELAAERRTEPYELLVWIIREDRDRTGMV
ncbi:MAG: amidohydrolase family protein, partial [Gemmatimonadetes bacterium]|nr:amidohydrolase family protein [Gemmatimonadota bacterium]